MKEFTFRSFELASSFRNRAIKIMLIVRLADGRFAVVFPVEVAGREIVA